MVCFAECGFALSSWIMIMLLLTISGVLHQQHALIDKYIKYLFGLVSHVRQYLLHVVALSVGLKKYLVYPIQRDKTSSKASLSKWILADSDINLTNVYSFDPTVNFSSFLILHTNVCPIRLICYIEWPEKGLYAMKLTNPTYLYSISKTFCGWSPPFNVGINLISNHKHCIFLSLFFKESLSFHL